MIPELNEGGFLPPGIHRADLDDFEERFAIFDRSDRRLQLYEQLKRFIEAANKTAIVKQVFVGGSFVTSQPEPNDFDCILALDSTIAGTTLRPFEYHVISRRMVRRLFGGNVLVALVGSKALDEYLAFFQTTRDGEPMGIVEISR